MCGEMRSVCRVSRAGSDPPVDEPGQRGGIAAFGESTGEGRRIQPETFIQQYFEARQVVNRLKASFGAAIRVDLLLKNIDGSNRVYLANVDQIDSHIPEKYDATALQAMLGLTP